MAARPIPIASITKSSTDAYFLERKYPVRLSVLKIDEILGEKYVIYSMWCKNQKRGIVPVASCVRAIIQMDTVAFGHLFAFTGVTIYTKETEVVLRPGLTSEDGPPFSEPPCRGGFQSGPRRCNLMAAQSSKGHVPRNPARLRSTSHCPPVHKERIGLY
ncbi:MAG: hypothetical protein ABI988_04310 [Nitrospirota bacterium]